MNQTTPGKQRICASELLFALYYFAFYLVRPLAVAVPALSTYFLMGSTFLIVLVYLCINLHDFERIYVSRLLVMVVFVYALFFVDACFRPSSYIFSYAYQFMIYGLIPLFLLLKISDYGKLLRYWSSLAILVGILFSGDPFNGYAWTENYMAFGFGVAIPAFAGSVLLAMYFHKRWAVVFEVLFFLEVVVFANKSSTLIAGFIFIAGYVYFSDKGKINKLRLTLVVFGVTVVYLLRTQIINTALSFAQILNANSYALKTFEQIINGTGSSIYQKRLDIWEKAWTMIWEHPIFGNGIGAFESQSEGYVHNVCLDIWTFGGIVGLLVFLALLVASIVLLFRSKDQNKRVFDLTMLILWIVPMQFSLTLWSVIAFWVYFGSIYIKAGTRNYIHQIETSSGACGAEGECT